MSRMIRFRLVIGLAAGVGLWLGGAGIGWGQESEVSQAGWRSRICPPRTVLVYPSETAPAQTPPSATEARPGEGRPPAAATPEAMTAPDNALAGGVGAAFGYMLGHA